MDSGQTLYTRGIYVTCSHTMYVRHDDKGMCYTNMCDMRYVISVALDTSMTPVDTWHENYICVDIMTFIRVTSGHEYIKCEIDT